MTEEEAAARLCALLNEIEEAGHEVTSGMDGLWVGDHLRLAPPNTEEEPWEVI